jgi:hypothetical protein
MPSTRTESIGRRGSDGEAPRRLVVELGAQAAADLTELVRSEDLNKTTLVNKAIQLYAILRNHEREGGRILLQESETKEVQRLLLL